MSTTSSNSGNYEFSQEQNLQFKAASYWMGIMGRLGIFFGGLGCLSALTGNIPGLVGGAVGIVVSVWTLRASSAFSRVAASTGDDIEHVMQAVANIKSLYRLQAILIGIVFGLMILAIASQA